MTSTRYAKDEPAVDLRRRRIVLRLTTKQHELVRQALQSGLYGRTEREVIERLICRSLIEMTRAGTLVP